ncbi:MAG: hypothetical protein ACRDY2_00285 [Acidimicrobiales bacterium]
MAFGRRVYVPGDPKGEWTLVPRAIGGTAIQLGVGTTNRLNPLDEGPRPSGVVDALLDPTQPSPGSSIEQLRTDGREIGHALARLVRGDLGGLFDAPSTIGFDPAAPMLTLDLSAISGSDTLIGLVMTCASTWMEAALADPGGGQRLVVYDEAWRLLAQPALLARMQAQWKLSRAWGLANLMVVHRLSDLDAVGDTGS